MWFECHWGNMINIRQSGVQQREMWISSKDRELIKHYLNHDNSKAALKTEHMQKENNKDKCDF